MNHAMSSLPITRLLLLGVTMLFISVQSLRAQSYNITTHAGVPGVFGSADSQGFFSGVYGMTMDAQGNVFAADYDLHVIRRITPSGAVSTFAGQASTAGNTDAMGTAARFNSPVGVVFDASGNLFVADWGNHTIRKITPAGLVSTYAGMAGASGSADGTGTAARFNRPAGLGIDAAGNLYLADQTNRTIRKITPAGAVGAVTTLAGAVGQPGAVDGTGNAARFGAITGLCADAGGNVFVADRTSHTIRKITPAGVVTTISGLAGTSGSADGTGTAARFNGSFGITIDGSGILFIADTYNQTVRRVTQAGAASTFAGLANVFGYTNGAGGAARFDAPIGVLADTSGNVLVTDFNFTLRRISAAGVVSHVAGTPGIAGAASTAGVLNNPSGVSIDTAGNVFVADSNNNGIRKITPAGVVTLFAGDPAGASGNTNGTGTAARFNLPYGMVHDSGGNLFVADFANHTIRMITAAGLVSTFAGSAGASGSADGTGATARFFQPFGIAIDAMNNLYVSDYGNRTLRKITPAGVVTTMAGLAGNAGDLDGTGNMARFQRPAGVAVAANGDVFVTDYNAHTIRKVTQAGVTTTLAGQAGSLGTLDGPGIFARFHSPSGAVIDADGGLLIADQSNDSIRKVTLAGVVSTYAGASGLEGSTDGAAAAARFSAPVFIAKDSAGNLFVGDAGNHAVRKLSTAKVVTTIAGNPDAAGATNTQGVFSSPYGTTIDPSGNIFVADYGNHTIRKITPGGVITTFAGQAGASGSVNGTGSVARFNNPLGVAADASGNVYVADYGNSTIRVITPVGAVSTYAGTAGATGSVDGTGATARFNFPYDVAVDQSGNVLVSDTGNQTIRRIAAGAVVTTLAGTAMSAGTADGTGAAARFSTPAGITTDAAGNVYVCDQGNHTIRKITPAGVVTTMAGTAGAPGSADGTGGVARFNLPFAVECDAAGNLFVCDRSNNTLRKISAAGAVTTIAGLVGQAGSADGIGADARFSQHSGITVDAAGVLYIVDKNNSTIRKGVRASAKAQLVSPANGSTLIAPATTFTWNKGVGVTQYALFIGSTAGAYDLYAGIEGVNLSKVVTLPVDRKVYVTMYSFIGGVWQGNGYVFDPAPSQKAVLTSPAQASTLASATLNLQWAAGLGASQYACWIGSSYGRYDLGAGAYTPGTNTATFTVPTDGGPVYVTLWSYINAVWQRSDYWFITQTGAGNRPARLTSPAVNGSTLAGTSTTFNWDAGAGTTSHALWVGNAPDGYDIYNALEGAGTSRNVTLPADCRKIYVTVHSLIGGAYQSNSYQFTCANVGNPAATVATPATGSSLGSASLALTWNAGTGVSNYALWVGSTPGAYDLYSGSEGLNVNKTVTGLPTDGRVLHVTLWSLINGVYQNNTAWYIGWNNGATQRAHLTSHASGASLPDAATPFVWNTGAGVTSYALWVGSTVGGYDLYNALEGMNTTRLVTLPTDGRKVYVTLHSLIGGAYVSNSYVFTAPQTPASKAVLTTPANGTTFSSASATFTWQANAGVTMYALWIGSQAGGNDLYAGAEGLGTSRTVNTLPTDARPIHVTLYSFINGAWQSNSYIYRAWQTP